MTDSIGGLWVALATPLDAAGAISHPVMARHAGNLIDQGCDGVVLFGTSGEGTSFSGAERLAATEALLASGIPAPCIALGAGAPAIPDAIALTRSMLSLGLHHVLLLPPYFYRDVGAQGIEDAFAEILDGVADDRLRATLYHIPQVSGVAVPPGAVTALRTRYGKIVAGVKDSSGNFSHFQAFRAAAPDVAVTIGNEVDIGRALAEGGAGTICGLGNLAPDLVRAMFTDKNAAVAMRAAVALIDGPFVPVLKSALAALTDAPEFGRVRAPLRAADPALGRRIAASLATLRQSAAA